MQTDAAIVTASGGPLALQDEEPPPPNRRWWTKKRQQAAQLLAEGVAWHEVMRRVGRSSGWLSKTHAQPAFKARVAKLRREIEQALLSEGIARKAERIKAMQARWEALQRIIAERAAAAPPPGAPPGWATGLLREQIRTTAKHVVREYVVDRDLLRELRELERAAAEELGQLPRPEVTYNDNRSLVVVREVVLRGVDDEPEALPEGGAYIDEHSAH